jgi:Mg2+/Co2+ transporter CorC
LSEADHEAAETVGGLAMARLGRIPVVGDEVAVDERWRLKVEEKDGLRVAGEVGRRVGARPPRRHERNRIRSGP